MIKKKIAVLAGDGIGPEICEQAIKILQAVDDAQHFEYTYGYIGGAAFDKYGQHFPKQTELLCDNTDAILFGSVGGPIEEADNPKWKNCEANSILALRKGLNLCVNIRPTTLPHALSATSPLKTERIGHGVDFIIVRELVGDLYFGLHQTQNINSTRTAFDECIYDEDQISIAAHHAFRIAQKRKKQVISVDKANVLDTSKLWRQVVSEVANDYPDVSLEHMLVDNCAMQLILNPSQFDVIVTSNMFGDILSDLAASLPGSLGLMPSASLGTNGKGLYEPSGGSAPSLAGKDVANPIGMILSAALMLNYSFAMHNESSQIENAVKLALEQGYRTKDIHTDNTKLVSTQEMTNQIIASIK